MSPGPGVSTPGKSPPSPPWSPTASARRSANMAVEERELAVARIGFLRSAIGSLITGLQTMPSIAWFPLAIVLLGLTEQAILFVVVLGAAPSIANGVIAGVDHVPPLWVRAGRMMGARNLRLYRHVVFPASFPTYVAGLKQGWAFAWRSLMAGELLVIVAHRPSIGVGLQQAREAVQYPEL